MSVDKAFSTRYPIYRINQNFLFFLISFEFNFYKSPGSSVVEHVPEEHSVGGSIPSLGTIYFL